MKHFLTTALLLTLAVSCQSPTPEQSAAPGIETAPVPVKEKTDGEKILGDAVVAHGDNRYETANYSFIFLKKNYTFKNDGTSYRYSVSSEKDGVAIVDVLDNGKLTRTLDGVATELSAKGIAKYTEDLNSVIYFATLPHKLLDPAVQTALLDSTSISGKPYSTLRVQFAKEGGGTDHDDNFRYWINWKTNQIDYLAYDYKTSGGGVRFRSAYNPRVVSGILFQDYVNYKAPVGTSLDSLPALFEQGKLEELSRIETEEVQSLK
ncbi:MAG: hypothetical protein ACI9G6_002692 [Limisphaerales bacterium]|jgi:hypothetical protein